VSAEPAYDAGRARRLFEFVTKPAPRPDPPEDLVQLFMPSMGSFAAGCCLGPVLASTCAGGLFVVGLLPVHWGAALVFLAFAGVPGFLALWNRSLRRTRVRELLLDPTKFVSEFEVSAIDGRAITFFHPGAPQQRFTETIPPTWTFERGHWYHPSDRTIIDVGGTTLCALSTEPGKYAVLWGQFEKGA
jgi:hypothetical protein